MTTQLELAGLKRVWIDDAVISFARFYPGHRFTADELHSTLPTPDHDGWWGCLVAKLRCNGRIREIGRVKSTRPERNGAKITLWETL